MGPSSALLHRHPNIPFLVDEAFIGLSGLSVAHLVPQNQNLLVTRTLSKAHSLAGFRVGIMILISVFELVPELIAITGMRDALTTMIVSAAVI